MGFLGSLTGWDQSNAAVNALLGIHYLKNADPSERRTVVDQIVKIIQSVQPRLTREQILTDFSKRGIVSQMGFVALACDYLGFPPPIRGNVWTVFKNPYLIGEQVTESHIQAEQHALLKQDGVKVEWPGCNTCLDFRMLAGEPYVWGDEYDADADADADDERKADDEEENEDEDELDSEIRLVTEEDEEAYGADLIDLVRGIAIASFSLPDTFLLEEGKGATVTQEDIDAFGGGLVYLVRRMAELARALLGRPSPNFSQCPLGSKEDVDAFGADLLELIERIILESFEVPHLRGILLKVFVREA